MATRKPAIKYQIPLHAGMKERLERISALTGVPAATLASFAIRSWVAQQERTLALIEGLGDAVGGEMGPRLKEMLRTGLLARQQSMADRPELTDDEVGAIAEHQALSKNAAAGLGSALLQSKEGLREIERLIHENIENAKAQGQSGKAEDLERILAHFKDVRPLAF